MNAIPIFLDQSLNKLSNDGWDWLVKKGIEDYENNIVPNSLGGLQIIVKKKYQGKGYSTLLISKAKELRKKLRFKNFIIPIRPILKHKYPEMKMEEYINLKEGNVIYDPWIRVHLKNGARFIKVCENSMNVAGDIRFWEKILNKKITKTGLYMAEGALSPISIDVEKNQGEYREENIWICYE